MGAIPETDRRRVFISYGHDELAALAKKLKADLAARGHEVWFDEDRIPTGADWESSIERGIDWVSENDRGRIVLLMTPHAVRRPDGYCLNELSLAIQRSVKIIPVMLVWCEPPLSICRIQWLDMRDCVPLEERRERYEAKFRMLVDALERDRLDFQGFQAQLATALNPLSFDAEVRYNLDRFTGRAWVIAEIDRWLASGSRVFWMVGGPGVGKTAIAAWLCANRRDISAFHFCRYDNVQKIDPRRCVTSIAYQLSTQLPDYADMLKRHSLEGMGELNAKTLFDHLIVQPLSVIPRPEGNVLVLIDALDEATVDGKNPLTSFIASEFDRAPDWLRLIITSRPDPGVISTLQAYSPYLLNIADPRNIEDLRLFLRRELTKFNHDEALSRDTLEAVLDKCGGLFLYSEWMVRELANGRLSLDRLDEFPRGLGGIYLEFFQRQFPDAGLWEEKVRPGLEVLAALQEPLKLKSLTAIFGWSVHEERRFRMSLGSFFKFDGGVMQPFHKSVMEWLTDEEKNDPYFVSLLEGHRILADHGYTLYRRGQSAWTRYLVLYLVTHLHAAGRLDDLKEVLSDLRFLGAMWLEDRFNLLKQWTFLEETTDLRMADVYRPVIDSLANESFDSLEMVAELLTRTFHLDIAMSLWEHLIDRSRREGDPTRLQRCLGSQAGILIIKSDYPKAMEILKEQERMCRETGELEGLQYSLLNQATILHYTNDFDVAMGLLKEQERICRDTGNRDGLQRSLSLQGLILRVRGDFGGTMALVKEREAICRDIGNLDGLQSSLIDQALILRAWGDLDDALRLLEEARDIGKKIGNKEDLQVCIGSIAMIHRWKGDLDLALELVREQERIAREIGNMFSVGEAMTEYGHILYLKGDLDLAMNILKVKADLSKKLGDRWGLQSCYHTMGCILLARGDIDGAMAYHREEERICREIGHPRDLAVSLSHQAVLIRMKGDLPGAMALHDEAERTFRKIGYKYGLQECLGFKAMTLWRMGEHGQAMDLLREKEILCTEMGTNLALQDCRKDQSLVLESLKALRPVP